MESDEARPLIGDGLSALAMEKTGAVRQLLASKDFMEKSEQLAKHFFDKAWSIDPHSETEIGPTPFDMAEQDDKTAL